MSIPLMLATLTDRRDFGEDWLLERKFDGERCVARKAGDEVRLESRNGKDLSGTYPEVDSALAAQRSRQLLLDGEVVAFDDEGRPSFELLQTRMHLASDSAVKRRMRDTPVTYVIFDLLYLDGHSTMPLTYEERRELLDQLDLEGPAWRTPRHHVGDGAVLLEATERMGVEGIVAKRLDSLYEPGRRSSAWIKVKNVCRQEMVIGGFTSGEGSRGGHVGALAVGYYDDGKLVYAGKVGTGFTETTLATLSRELEALRRKESPFSGRQPPKATVFVEPQLVADVEFREWTKSGTLRAPSFKGLRPDIDPEQVVREPQVHAR